ncbi:MAG: MaoC family dehydratase [Dehalococcoidia bacterium]
MPATREVIENRFTAWMDNPNDPTISNKIHAADGAKEYGFQAALVGGVTVYGWCVPTILQAAGEGWLDNGWAEVHFRRPTYPGDEMTIRATPLDDGSWGFVAEKQGGEVCIRGQFGLGEGPFNDTFELSKRLPADPPLEQREWLTLENAPVGKDLRTLPINISAEEAREISKRQLRETNPLFVGENPVLNPSLVARQMMTLLSYTVDYGKPSIHVSSHIQNLRRIPAGVPLALTGHYVKAWADRHHYGAFDGDYVSPDGSVEYARIRHTNIFRVAKKDE